jgi:peptidoglycan/xylan/chitin deacetylase (PgdA/CDA1 family)
VGRATAGRGFMNGVGKSLAMLLWATGAASVLRRLLMRRGRLVIELHDVASRDYPELPERARPVLTAEGLASLLAWLRRRFELLTPQQFLAAERAGVLLTFDDGFANNHDVVLPLLERFEAPAVFFVTTSHVARPRGWLPFVRERAAVAGPDGCVPEATARDLFDGMSAGQLRACGGHPLVTIGSHTVSHPRLTTLGDAELGRELTESRDFLQQVCGQSVELLAYPFGEADARVAQAAEVAGFSAAFVEESVPGLTTPMGIPRVGIYGTAPWYLAAKMSGVHPRRLPVQTS